MKCDSTDFVRWAITLCVVAGLTVAVPTRAAAQPAAQNRDRTSW